MLAVDLLTRGLIFKRLKTEEGVATEDRFEIQKSGRFSNFLTKRKEALGAANFYRLLFVAKFINSKTTNLFVLSTELGDAPNAKEFFDNIPDIALLQRLDRASDTEIRLLSDKLALWGATLDLYMDTQILVVSPVFGENLSKVRTSEEVSDARYYVCIWQLFLFFHEDDMARFYETYKHIPVRDLGKRLVAFSFASRLSLFSFFLSLHPAASCSREVRYSEHPISRGAIFGHQQ